MILDMNVLLGRWPFAPIEYDTVKGVLTLMDRAGIDVGVATSLDSIFYYECETGNRRVGKVCRQYPDRFIPLAVINPLLLSWQVHLHQCLDDYGVKGIKLHPDYHKFSLLEEPAAQVMNKAQQLDLPVYIQTSILDMRHHPGYCFVPEVPIAEVAQAVERYPENTFIISGGKHFAGRVNELLCHTKNRNFYLVTDGLGGPFDGLGELVERIGSDRLLFGTRTPILYAEAAKWTVEQSAMTEQDKAKIFGENAAQLLKIADK